MPTARRSSTKVHSAAIRLMTSSAVKIGGILTAARRAGGSRAKGEKAARSGSVPVIEPRMLVRIRQAAQARRK